jgi:hypothetical protein
MKMTAVVVGQHPRYAVAWLRSQSGRQPALDTELARRLDPPGSSRLPIETEMGP